MGCIWGGRKGVCEVLVLFTNKGYSIKQINFVGILKKFSLDLLYKIYHETLGRKYRLGIWIIYMGTHKMGQKCLLEIFLWICISYPKGKWYWQQELGLISCMEHQFYKNCSSWVKSLKTLAWLHSSHSLTLYVVMKSLPIFKLSAWLLV